ncbi:DMT family transporter [Emergencia timonensis]
MQTAIRKEPGGAVQIKMKHTRIYILMVLAAFCWSGAFIAGKFAVPYIPTVSLTFGRFVVATVAMGFIKKYMEAKNPEEKYIFQKTDLKKFLFTGIVGMVGYHIFFFLSLKYTTAINSSIIGATNPVVTALLALAFLKQKLPLKQVLGIVLSLFGVVLTITAGDLSVLAAFELNKGDLIMCLAVVVWAAYGVYSKSRCAGISPVAITYYSFLVCTLVLIPFVLLEKPWEFLPGVPAEAYIAVVFMAIFPSCFSYLVQQIAIKEIGPARASVFINLVPIFSFVLATLILGETLQPVKILTAALIIAGVCICQLSGNTKEGIIKNGK